MPISPEFAEQSHADRTPAPARRAPDPRAIPRASAERLDGVRGAGAHRGVGPSAAVPDAPLGGRRRMPRQLRRRSVQRDVAADPRTLPAERVVAFAVQTAEEIDAFLLAVPDDVVAAALARPHKPNLDRGSHREYHLDQIERAVS